VYRELGETVEGGFRKWSISLYRSSVRGTWRHKRGPSWETWEVHMLEAYVWKEVLGWVSFHIGAQLGKMGRRGGPSTGNFEN